VKGLFKKDKPPPPPEITAPYGMYGEPDNTGNTADIHQAFQHISSVSPVGLRDMAGPEHGYSVAADLNNLTIDSSSKEQSPSPPPFDCYFEGDTDNKDDGTKTIKDDCSDDEQSTPLIQLEQIDVEVANKDVDMTPAEREARRLGLELDFEPVRRMQAESPSFDHVVREYTDLSPSFYSAHLTKPIYDGKTITTTAKAETPITHALPAPEPIGQWRCCKCTHAQDLYHHPKAEHPVSILNCICPHRSCENCSLTGTIKPYMPVSEPIPVQLSDSKVKFGIFCSTCGLSWRAQPVKNGVLDKISAVPKEMSAKLVKNSKSMHNLRETGLTKSVHNLRALSNEMEKEHGKQESGVMVRFSGIACTCGNMLGADSLCFQIVEALTVEKEKEVKEEHVIKRKPVSTFTATPEDRAKGLGKSTLTLEPKGRGRIRHVNPLMSNPA
jgi:hypothetical protein